MPYIGRSTEAFGVRSRFTFLASADDTSVSGNDVNGLPLSFTDGAYVDVFLNGVKLKSGTDYVTTTANTISSLSALAANDEIEVVEYMVPKGKLLAVQEGDFIRKGDLVIDGSPVPHDILNILGVEELANYLVKEVQDVYRLQGVKINDKHIEVIVRQMTSKVRIEDAGDTTLLPG